MKPEPAESQPASSSPPEAETISVCIICRNEADKLGPCLESVAWADEILVMDLKSTDGTAALALAHHARLLEHEPVPFADPLRDELATQARGAWVLAMDPDERVTPGLAGELRRAAQHPELDAVVIPFTNYDLGYPPSAPIHRYEAHLRMYRPGRVSWPAAPNMQPVVADERKYQIPHDDRLVMIHDRSRNVPEIVDRVTRVAPVQAQYMLDQGQVFSAKAMLLAMAQVMDKQFVEGRPWEDGVPGVLRAGVLVAFKFYVWTAFWQVSGAKRTVEDDRLLRLWGPVLVLPARMLRVGARAYRLFKRIARL